MDTIIKGVDIKDEELLMEIEEMSAVRKAIETGIEKTTAIISSLRNYAYSGKDTFKRYDAIICIKDALLLLQNNYKYRITIIEEFPESLELDCVPGKLNQLFVNLINNAIQAITDKGSITLTAEYRDMHTAVFKIKDTGKGISSNELNKIFDPFFTTKEVGQGTGLGLYIVHGIIGLHKGKIEVESIIGEGTVFTIYIPLIHQDLES
jgi:signal transduction histidine kinase